MNTKKIFGYGLIAVILALSLTTCKEPDDKTLTGITLNHASVNKAYTQGQALNLAGLAVTANYSDGSSAAVTNYTANPADGAALSTTGPITVTISYAEGGVTKSADFSVTVAAKALTGITADYTGTAAVYTITPLDSLKEDLTVTPQYNDGSDGEPLAPQDYSLSGTLTAPSSTITVTYQGKTDTFNVTVSDATLSSITVTFNQNSATIYTSTSHNDLKQYLTVTATYSDNFTATLTAGEYTLSGDLTAGTPIITVSYGDKTQTFTPTVTAVVLESITAQFTGTVAIYTSMQLDSLKQYLSVKAIYNDGNQETLEANEYTLTGVLTTIGTQTITVTYTDGGVTRTATFTVSVTAVTPTKTLSSITLNTASVNKTYTQNETLNLSGLVVTATYSDSTSATVTYTAASPANGATLSSIGIITVTVSYTEGGVTRSGNFTVTVTDPNAGTPGLTYTLITEGENANTYSVSKGSVTSGAVVIPATYNGLPVTKIGYYGFYQINITSVTIPASVKIIDEFAFQYCTSLTSITIPSSVTSIGNYAFGRCTSLTDITIPESVTTIGNWAFHDCTGLTSVTIPNSVTSIGYDAFNNCTGLTSVTITAGVTSVLDRAFNGCTSLATVTFAEGSESINSDWYSNFASLTTVNIPASVTTIGDSAFNGSGLTSINVDAANTAYASQNGIVYNKAKTEITRVPRGISSSFTIPDSVTSIGNYAFYNCTGLTEITIPNSVTTIGERAFYNCTGLTSITIGSGVTSIGNYAFYNCTGLTSITIGSGVTTIGERAFYNCTGLTGITIPNNVTTIGEWAFGYCTGLTSVTIPDSVTSIGNYAFYCGNLKNIVIDSDKLTFTRDRNLLSIFTAENLSVTFKKNVPDYALYPYNGWADTRLTSVTIEEGVTSIGDYAFYNCTGLTDITIPNSVTSIGGEAFSSCTGLTSVTIPASVTAVGNYAFSDWTASQTIYVEGYASQGLADTAWGTTYWRYCNAHIVYLADVETDITVTNTAQWNDAMTLIKNAGNNRDFTLTIGGSFNVAGSTVGGNWINTFGTAANVSVTLKGSGTLTLNSNGNMLRIAANQTVIIDSENLTLQGRNDNNQPLVYVYNANAQLELRNGKLTGNRVIGTYPPWANGGGVCVASGGTFIMSGGAISGNTARAYFENSNNSYDDANANGGGVYVESGTFIMTGGTISGNTASAEVTGSYNASSPRARGGGVCVGSSGTFLFVTGTIYGNTESATSLRNTLTASGGIANNRVASGAALHKDTNGTAERGTFSGETWVSSGTLTTTNDTINVVNGELQ